MLLILASTRGEDQMAESPAGTLRETGAPRRPFQPAIPFMVLPSSANILYAEHNSI
jgi:hypothetical protein